jgi:hypothetical protein
LSDQQPRSRIRGPRKRQTSAAVRRDQFWKWPRERYEPFMRQLHHSIHQPPELLQTSLIPITPSQDELDRHIADHFAATWSWVIEHPAFRPLKDDTNFRRAWLTLQGRQGLSPLWETPKDCGAACRFVYLVALWHGVYSVPGLPAALSPRDAKGAPVRVDKVRAGTRKDIERLEYRLADPVIASELGSDGKLLTQLLARTKSTLVRPRLKGPGQKDLFGLAKLLVDLLGPVNSTLFTEIATAVGLSCDERTARRYLREARKPS